MDALMATAASSSSAGKSLAMGYRRTAIAVATRTLSTATRYGAARFHMRPDASAGHAAVAWVGTLSKAERSFLHGGSPQIGRASCRERVDSAGVGVEEQIRVKKK